MQTLRTLSFTLLVAVLTFGLTACATNQPVDQQVDDAAITTAVKSKLTGDPEVNALNVDVDTLDGVVTLRGEVEKTSAKMEAEKLARNTDGVRRVHNQLQVVSAMEEDDEPINDAWIKTKVASKITGDPQLNPLNIDVDVDDGVVTLSGVVKNRAHRAEAEKLARNTQGVTRVQNELQIKSK